MEISQATLSDVALLVTLINSAYRGESSKKGWTTEADLLDGIRVDAEDLSELIQKPNSIILKCLSDAGELIGCVNLQKHGSKLYLGMLTVFPELQAQGIGKFILNESEGEAKKLNCTSIYMTVITDRTELIAWYERHGYMNTGKKKPFPMGDPRFGIAKKHLEFVVLEKKI